MMWTENYIDLAGTWTYTVHYMGGSRPHAIDELAMSWTSCSAQYVSTRVAGVCLDLISDLLRVPQVDTTSD